MKVLVADDTDSKAAEIEGIITDFWPDNGIVFHRTTDVADTVKSIHENRYDLIVIDLLMPRRSDSQDELEDVSMELLSYISESENNSTSRVIAITQHSSLASENERAFLNSGIITVHYENTARAWVEQFKASLKSIKFKMTIDFVIVCALEKERQGFKKTQVTFIDNINFSGLDCSIVKLDDKLGICIVCPKVGPIDAAIVTSKALQRFEPKLICMSGICAGIPKNIKKGQSILVEEVWDHESGKFTPEGLVPDIYQTSIPNMHVVEIKNGVEKNDELNSKVMEFAELLNVENGNLESGPMVTGSSVIASIEKRDTISGQHRKIMAIDMEMVSLYRAVSLQQPTVKAFGIKTVVDYADGEKDDSLHQYGCQVSALYSVEAIKLLLKLES